MSLWLAMLFCMMSCLSSFANNNCWDKTIIDTSFACNDLVQVSLNEFCDAELVADMILEGFDGDLNEFAVEVLDEVGLPVLMPVNESHIGDTLFVIVVHTPSGNSCWGKALIEDKWAPSLTCTDYSFNCYEEVLGFPLPAAHDNCDPSPTITLLSINVDDSDLCSLVTITSTYIAYDDSGNESMPCVQVVTTTPPSLPSFPADTVWSCIDYNFHPNIIQPNKLTGNLNTTGSGAPDVSMGDFCPYNTVHQDFLLNNDCGETFTILRTWTVINWCTDEIITIGINGEENVQLIKIEDTKAPIIERPSFSINANIGSASNEECGSTVFLLPPQFVDDCNNVSIRIFDWKR